jgi:small subunit ribosomal protein S6
VNEAGCSIQKGGFILLREYEFTIVAKGDLPDADKQKVFAGYEEILKREGGEFVKRDDWGNKRMAFPVRKNFRGHYMFSVTLSSKTPIKLTSKGVRLNLLNKQPRLSVKLRRDNR